LNQTTLCNLKEFSLYYGSVLFRFFVIDTIPPHIFFLLSKRNEKFVGTPTNLLAYDVVNNEDIYYREIADGVREMVIGKLGSTTNDNMAIIGGNCSIIGLDNRGAEAFWTVCGDNVGAMSFVENSKKQYNDLLVGSDDYGLRLFDNEEQMWEVFEAASFTSLKALKNQTPGSSNNNSTATAAGFSFSLSNGTIGVYEGNKRLWRVKSKYECRALVNWDSTGDGVLDVATGWGNGGVVVRRADNGQVLFKQPGKQPVAGMLSADYRMESDGSHQLIVCSEAGEVCCVCL
jgi:Bardet-Biedl syndrome 2 protein